MVCRLFGTKPLPKSTLAYYQSDLEMNFSEMRREIPMILSIKCIWKLRQRNGNQSAFLSCVFANSLKLGNACPVIQSYKRVIIKATIRLWTCQIIQRPSECIYIYILFSDRVSFVKIKRW